MLAVDRLGNSLTQARNLDSSELMDIIIIEKFLESLPGRVQTWVCLALYIFTGRDCNKCRTTWGLRYQTDSRDHRWTQTGRTVHWMDGTAANRRLKRLWDPKRKAKNNQDTHSEFNRNPPAQAILRFQCGREDLNKHYYYFKRCKTNNSFFKNTIQHSWIWYNTISKII